MFDLSGKVVLLTGATGGIGKAIASVFLKAKAKVIATSTSLEKLKNFKKELGDHDSIYPLVCDLGDNEQLENLFDNAESLGAGEVDILVCNAGITKDQLAVRMKEDDWYQVLNINLTSIFKLNQAALKKMMFRRSGRIINVSSVVAYTGNFGQANYTAAKAGIIGMSKSLALEVAKYSVTVNCIAPGFIDTSMTSDLSESIKEKIIANIPMGRIGKPEEVGAAALFLASDESSYVTGTTIHVNGGMYMS